MQQGNLTMFTADRFGNSNSALSLNGGWTFVPAGVFFNTPEFSVTCWIYPSQIGAWSRLFDFGNGPNLDNIGISFSKGWSLLPYAWIFQTTNSLPEPVSSFSLRENVWQFLSLTFNSSHLSIFIDGHLSVSKLSLLPTLTSPPLIRTSNYIGKSNWVQDGFSYSYLDDLKFYNISLSESQINDVMHSNISHSTMTFTCLNSNSNNNCKYCDTNF